jgi:hypothetical protein
LRVVEAFFFMSFGEHEKREREVELEKEEAAEHWHESQGKGTARIPRQKVQPATGRTVWILRGRTTEEKESLYRKVQHALEAMWHRFRGVFNAEKSVQQT